jgi:hypothetical protein
MRPKFSVWSDYGAPAQMHWMSPKRGTGSSSGPRMLLAAAVVVAGVIGISGIYPQVIDAGWVQDSPTHLPKMSLSDPTIRRSGIAAAIPLPLRRAVTTGEAMFSSPPAPEPLAETATPLGGAKNPDAQAEADALPAGAAKLAERSRAAVVAKKAGVVQKKVVRVEHRQRSYSGAFAQNGGWGWPGGGWAGFSSFSEIASARRYNGSASLSRFVARSNNARFATVGWSGP